jgi:hypothetical protein
VHEEVSILKPLLRGQELQVVPPEGLTKLINKFDAVTISASVNKVSQITRLENANELGSLSLFMVSVDPLGGT